MCKDYLQKGSCPAGESCDLSHNATPERAPACLHFLRGKCTNSSCRYTHVRVNPSAPVCRDFAILGYCAKGSCCDERHVHECPNYAESGICRNKKCRLPHIDRAGQLKKYAANAIDNHHQINTVGPAEEETDLTSEEEDYDEIDSDDVDSDGLEDDLMDLSEDAEAHALSQQQDFVRFSS